MRNSDKPGHKPAKCTCRGFQGILKALLSGRGEQFVGILMKGQKGYQVASRHKYQYCVEILDGGKPW